MRANKQIVNLKWISTLTLTDMVVPKYSPKFSREFSLELVSGDWDKATVPLELHPKAIYCRSRWEYGLDWNRTIAPSYYKKMIRKYGSIDKCKSLEDAFDRLNKIDLIYSAIQKSGSIMSRFELSLTDSPNDETGGIFVHFDRHAKPIFGGGGWHRLMIARILGISVIPIQVGLIHKDISKYVNLKDWLTSVDY